MAKSVTKPALILQIDLYLTKLTISCHAEQSEASGEPSHSVVENIIIPIPHLSIR